ncbi:acyltransferase family protein [Mangrovicella endophytica]|uniref:acyltransferase family protein n=1 Tax=Mangrovicella endophytica TaxID=2066697 RepID=UPI000C9E48A5|nr:acyltransferase [Mangrovicella endophytica]
MIVNLQYMRGIAALMVVLYHATENAARLGTNQLTQLTAGAAGVDIFFVISGFIMWVTTSGRDIGSGEFMRRRLIRILPLYWAATLALAALAILVPQLLKSTTFELQHFLGSLFFVPVERPLTGGYFPVVFVGWTLNYEMAFYLLFAVSLLLPERHRAWPLVAVLVAAAAAGALLEPAGLAGFYTRPLILEFGAGVLIGVLYTSRIAVPRVVSLASFLVGLALLAALCMSEGGILIAGPMAALLVFGAVNLEKSSRPWRIAPLYVLGNASYAIYLTHIVTIPLCQTLWRLAGLSADGWHGLLYVAVTITASAVVGIATYYLFELPVDGLLRRPRETLAGLRAMPRRLAGRGDGVARSLSAPSR